MKNIYNDFPKTFSFKLSVPVPVCRYTKHGEKSIFELNKNAMCCFEKYWKQQPTSLLLYGHLPSISTCIMNILIWTLISGSACVGRPAKTYIHQPCVNLSVVIVIERVRELYYLYELMMINWTVLDDLSFTEKHLSVVKNYFIVKTTNSVSILLTESWISSN